MSIYDVGVEGLPNVYINKLKLTTADGRSYRVLIEPIMFDSERRSWINRPELLNMNIRYVLVHDYNNTNYLDITTALNTGTIVLEQFASTTEQYMVIDLPPPAWEGTMEDGYFPLTTLTPFSLGGLPMVSTNNISIYAAAYLDDFNFTNPALNVFYGPLTSELILRNGLVNRISGYFYFPDTNEEYSGPVHYNPALGYMVGSTHKQFEGRVHRQLRYVQIENTKIDSDFD